MGLFASAAIAADHTDGSAAGVDGQPAADITDVYAWLKDDGETLVLIQNIVATDFSDSVQYVFHVGRADMALGALTAAPASADEIVCEFDAAGMISCWAGGEYVTGDASSTSGISNAANTLKVHAGPHADAFFFYLDGFETTVATVNAFFAPVAASADLAGCPTATPADITVLVPTSNCPNNTSIGAVLRGMLNGTYTDGDCTAGTASDNFAANNVSSIVMEINISLLAGAGDYLQVWASTHTKPGA
jgi:hypothetical protein